MDDRKIVFAIIRYSGLISAFVFGYLYAKNYAYIIYIPFLMWAIISMLLMVGILYSKKKIEKMEKELIEE